MKYSGIVLAESLESDTCLGRLNAVKRESWNIADPAPYQPNAWTAIFFENDGDMDEAAQAISACLKPAWYADLGNAGRKVIVFRDRIFSYVPGDAAGRADAVEYGRLAGIPVRQLDWKE
jgi:hypothetical protein